MFLMSKQILVGGQAVIEGVVMRVPGAYATAVRKPNGEIEVKRSSFQSLTERYPLLKKPIIRGAVSLFESLKIGLGTLQLSADIAARAEQTETAREHPRREKLMTILSTIFALGLAFLLFGVLPLFLTTKLLNIAQKALAFNLVAGVWRILFFLLYLGLISLLRDVKRLFQYHGAEHKVVFTFENGYDLNVANTREYRTFHPRCGTSFIFVVMLVFILMFALIDTIVILSLGQITLPMRIGLHLALLPLIAGVSYEVLKFTARHQESWWGRWLSQPGLFLQRITTKPPSDAQVEVAITALKAAFGERYEEYHGQTYVAEALE